MASSKFEARSWKWRKSSKFEARSEKSLKVGSSKFELGSDTGPAIATRHRVAGVPEPFSTRSFRFAVSLLQFYRVLSNPSHQVPRALAYQVLRSGTAIGANIEEARSAHSRRDLAAKYAVGLREARECHYWLRLIAADRPQFAETTGELIDECDQLIAVLTTTVKKLRAG